MVSRGLADDPSLEHFFVVEGFPKENFQNNPKCRLLNPTKCELEKISQQILSKIVYTIRRKTKFKQ